jgi:hypothetical protein
VSALNNTATMIRSKARIRTTMEAPAKHGYCAVKQVSGQPPSASRLRKSRRAAILLGQIVNLFKAGVSARLGRHEARMTRAAFAAGAPAPEVLGGVTLEGRFGLVLPRFDGPTLLQLLRARAVTYEQTGAILAALYRSVHRVTPPPDIVSLRAWIETASRLSGGLLPNEVVSGVLALIDRPPPGDGLCHADLHPGNVIVTAEGRK